MHLDFRMPTNLTPYAAPNTTYAAMPHIDCIGGNRRPLTLDGIRAAAAALEVLPEPHRITRLAVELDMAMTMDPAAQRRYQEIYGRAWTPVSLEADELPPETVDAESTRAGTSACTPSSKRR